MGILEKILGILRKNFGVIYGVLQKKKGISGKSWEFWGENLGILGKFGEKIVNLEKKAGILWKIWDFGGKICRIWV